VLQTDDPAANYAYTNTRDKLIIQPPEVAISGANAATIGLSGSFYGSKHTPTPVHLGSVHTDDQGRLVVLASNGLSFEIHTDGKPENQPKQTGEFESDDWVSQDARSSMGQSMARRVTHSLLQIGR
jgi:hypothetical protein